MTDAYIVDAIRTPIGRRGGGLAEIRPDDLAAHILRKIPTRNGIEAAEIEDVIMGCVTQIGEQGFNIGRTAVLAAGFPVSVPATSVNRMCGSSQQAVSFAAQAVMAGSMDLVLGAGVESMSRVAMGSDGKDLSPAITDRFEIIPQGLSAEFVAERWELTREDLDAFSFESHQRAVRTQNEGGFKREIVPVMGKDGDGREALIDRDEGPRPGTSLEKMASLKPVFKEDGLVTAANSSQITDGAAAVLVASGDAVKRFDLKPRARVRAMAVVGTDPTIMLTGPIPATRKVLDKAGMKLSDIDLFEVNEAFASVVVAWEKELSVPHDKVNVRGGAVALGHPLGCTGARLITTLLHALEDEDKRFGLVTMCIGFGMATATIIERL